MSYPQAARISAYKSIATHGAAAEADPHRLICMLMDGALERMAAARGCIERKDIVGKAGLLHRVGLILDELRLSLDHSVGGEIAANLDGMYHYIMRRVLHANLHNDTSAVDEAARLLQQIRDAWAAIPPQARAKNARP